MPRARPKPKSASAKSTAGGHARDFKRVVKAAAATKLPGMEEAVSYGSPSLKVKGKFLLRIREPDILVLMCALEEKEFLMANAPKIYFETDHYKGWPAVLIRLSKIKDDELTHRIAAAWDRQAPKKLKAEAAQLQPPGSGATKKR